MAVRKLTYLLVEWEISSLLAKLTKEVSLVLPTVKLMEATLSVA
jgi:hypothetical protein